MFKPNSLIGRFMSGLLDQLVLNFLFMIFCIPVVTIGAAWSGLYTAQYAIAEDRSNGAWQDFFKGFRENLKQSTVVFLILVALGLVILAALWAALVQNLLRTFLGMLLAAIVLAVYLGTVSWFFPLCARYRQKGIRQLYNAYVLAVGKLPLTLVMVLMNFWWIPAFLKVSPQLFNIYAFAVLFCEASLASFVNSRILLGALGRQRTASALPEEGDPDERQTK